MLPKLRRDFNARFTPQKYQTFLQTLDRRCGTHVQFRNCETPCFFPRELLVEMVEAGEALAQQLVGNSAYLDAARREIPSWFLTPNEAPYPLFVQADFGLLRLPDGSITPRLVEIQGFPSLYAYQPVLAEVYREAYDLSPALQHIMGDADIIKRAIVGEHDPDNVFLLEIDPLKQKTLADFLLTEKLCGVRTVDIRDVRKAGNKLYAGDVPIQRIYNRVIADEMVRRGEELPFHFSDDIDVEWAGHPNWFYLLSKFSLPYLKHYTVPRSIFLNDFSSLPDDLENFVLKPLYSFAGTGVKVGVSKSDIHSIPNERRPHYLLQERIQFEPVIATPEGMTQAEVRIMYIWTTKPVACTTIIRMGRGRMMGVDHNRDLEWVGASAGFWL